MGLIGASATFAPLMADTALWWNKRRGIAVAICASGNYIAGALWPPIVQHGIEAMGWRQTYVLMGLVCGAGMLLLALRMRQRAPMVLLDAASAVPAAPGGAAAAPSPSSAPMAPDRSRPFGLRPLHAQLLLCVAGVACCVAMAMPHGVMEGVNGIFEIFPKKNCSNTSTIGYSGVLNVEWIALL